MSNHRWRHKRRYQHRQAAPTPSNSDAGEKVCCNATQSDSDDRVRPRSSSATTSHVIPNTSGGAGRHARGKRTHNDGDDGGRSSSGSVDDLFSCANCLLSFSSLRSLQAHSCSFGESAAHDSSDDEPHAKNMRPLQTVQPRTRHDEAEVFQAAQSSSNKVSGKVPVASSVSEAPVFHPTPQEFRDPIRYIASISDAGRRCGIVKIVPPTGWKAPHLSVNPSATWSTTRQQIHQMQEGRTFGAGSSYSFLTYKRMALKFEKTYHSGGRQPIVESPSSSSARGGDRPSDSLDTPASLDEMEERFWSIIDTHGSDGGRFVVEYGNALDTANVGTGFPAHRMFQAAQHQSSRGSGFDCEGPMEAHKPTEPLAVQTQVSEKMALDPASSPWNLSNLPFVPGSPLRAMQDLIGGINVPWLSCGMLFASCCWRAEDHHLFSCSYLHSGAPKAWYGVGSEKAKEFEQVVQEQVPARLRNKPDLMFRLNFMISPSTLHQHGIPVFTTRQNPGEFVVTFPGAYHAGFCHGYNVGEAVNFATPSWLRVAIQWSRKYARHRRPSPLSVLQLCVDIGLKPELCALSAAQRAMVNKFVIRRCRQLARQLSELQALGMTVFGMDQSMPAPENKDVSRECCHCKQRIVFVAVLCTCQPTKLTCLRHHDRLCGCAPERKCLALWQNPKTMVERIEAVSCDSQPELDEMGNGEELEEEEENESDELSRVELAAQNARKQKSLHVCGGCGQSFLSGNALGGHRGGCKAAKAMNTIT